MDRYVTELHVPAPVYMPVNERKSLVNPEYYGCSKGYWAVYFDTDSLGTQHPLGVCLTTELRAPDREAAEDGALNAGERFAQVVTVTCPPSLYHSLC